MKKCFKILIFVLVLVALQSFGQGNPLLDRINNYEFLVVKEENSSDEHKEAIHNKVLEKLRSCNFPSPTDNSVLYSTSFDQSKVITLVYTVLNASRTAGELSCHFKFVNYNYEIIASHTVKEKYQFLNEKNYMRTVEKCFAFLDGYKYNFKKPEVAAVNTVQSGAAEEEQHDGSSEQSLVPPEIVLLHPKFTTSEFNTFVESLKLSGYVDSRFDVVSVKINEEVVQSDELGNFSVQIALKEGLNKISIQIENAQKQSAERTLKIVRTANVNGAVASDAGEESTYRGSDPFKGTNVANVTKEIKTGKYYALFIGVDAYTGAWGALRNAVNDGKAIENLLRTQYRFDVIRSLYDVQATRVNIIKELEWLVANVEANDNVLIYYSGHGEFKKELNKGYWVPVDAKTNSTAQFISNSEIQTFLAGIPSKHTLLVSDACFSGDIFRGTVTSIPFENSEKYYSKVYEVRSRQAISSGGIEPVMDGGKDGHSVFAYYMLQALAANSAKYFDATQLFSKIKIPVINNSEQSPNFHPVKNTGDEGGNFIFIRK